MWFTIYILVFFITLSFTVADILKPLNASELLKIGYYDKGNACQDFAKSTCGNFKHNYQDPRVNVTSMFNIGKNTFVKQAPEILEALESDNLLKKMYKSCLTDLSKTDDEVALDFLNHYLVKRLGTTPYPQLTNIKPFTTALRIAQDFGRRVSICKSNEACVGAQFMSMFAFQLPGKWQPSDHPNWVPKGKPDKTLIIYNTIGDMFRYSIPSIVDDLDRLLNLTGIVIRPEERELQISEIENFVNDSYELATNYTRERFDNISYGQFMITFPEFEKVFDEFLLDGVRDFGHRINMSDFDIVYERNINKTIELVNKHQRAVENILIFFAWTYYDWNTVYNSNRTEKYIEDTRIQNTMFPVDREFTILSTNEHRCAVIKVLHRPNVVTKILSAKLLANHYGINEETYDELVELNNLIKKVLISRLKSFSELSMESHQYIHNYITNSKEKVGFPRFLLNEESTSKFFDGFYLTNTWLKNIVLINEFQWVKKFQSAAANQHAISQSDWWPEVFRLLEANAENFRPDLNLTVIYPYLLIPPLYSKSYPNALKFGIVGYVMGHEFGHFVDADFDLSQVNHADQKKFEEKIHCVEKLANTSFCYSDIVCESKCVNGTISKNDIMADMTGIKVAFDAYYNYGIDYDINFSQKPQGFERFSWEQIFFLSAAVLNCEFLTEKELCDALTESHPPGPDRILGEMIDSEKFAKAFTCKNSDFMVKGRCNVWNDK